MCLRAYLTLIVIVVAGALALRPPRSGFGAGTGVNALVFGLFAAAIGMVALVGGAWQLRNGRVYKLTKYLIR